MQGFMGMIQAFGFNYPPANWSFCSGQVQAITQFQALYSLIGTFFGGNGTSTFALPDMRARMAVGSTVMGVSPTVPGAVYPMGTSIGTQQIALNTNNLAAHTHTAFFTPSGGGSNVEMRVSTNTGTNRAPAAGDYIAAQPALGTQPSIFVPSTAAGTTVALGGVSGGGGTSGTVTILAEGDGSPFYILNPMTSTTFSICLNGIYPSRN